MHTTKLTLYRGGTAELEIDLRTWDFPDLTALALMAPTRGQSKVIRNLNQTMHVVITAVRQGRPLPTVVYVPDLWHIRKGFPAEDSEELMMAVGAALAIARAYYSAMSPPLVRHRISHTRFSRRREV